MSPAEFQGGERAQRVAEQDVHSLPGSGQFQNRFVQVPGDLVEREAMRGPGALAIPAQVYGDRVPIPLHEPRPDPSPGTRRGRDPVYEHG